MDRWLGLLPTGMTLANGACGLLSIAQTGVGLALHEAEDLHHARHFHHAAWLILLGMLFDALDGFVARAVRKTSAYGAILDSLSDLLTFGAAPAFLVFAVAWRPEFLATHWQERLLLTTAVVYGLAALLRLAKFTANTKPDETSHRSFRGLPSPGAAGVVVGSVLVSRILPSGEVAPPDGWFRTTLLVSTFVAAFLMVSRVPYPHVVNQWVKRVSPILLGIGALIAVAVLAAFRGVAISVAFWGYAALGLVLWVAHLIHPGKSHHHA